MNDTKLLLVEDDKEWQIYFDAIIGKRYDFLHFDYATTLQEAKAKIEVEKYQLVLLDLMLPDSQYENTINEFQKLAQKIPIIIISTLSDSSIIDFALENGFDDFLIKDEYDDKLFLHVIKQSLRRAISKNKNRDKKQLDEISAKIAAYENIIKLASEQISKNITLAI